MPNWCSNRVTVSGDTDKVETFKKAVQGVGENDRLFSFNSIIPFPEELNGIGSPVTVVHTEEEIEQYKQDRKDSNFALGNLPITCKRSEELKNKYGSDNWYDWCTDNWTSKWDACDITLLDEVGYLEYRFDTPWGPPENIYHVLKLQHPDVYISWFYDEPGMQFAGYLKDEQ